jgi:hypothetical protein
LLPRILAFAGPQMTAAIGRTNRFWHGVIVKESTWRTLCEELYKVRVLCLRAKGWTTWFF